MLVLVNLILSAGLIFGLGGLPALGIEGAGIGFLGAEAAALVLLSVETVRRLDLAQLGLRQGRGDGEATAGAITRLGAPIGLQALIEALRWVAFFLIVEQLGERALAASSVVFACLTLLLIPSQAFAETAYTMVSAALGGNGPSRLRELMRSVTRGAFAVTLPLLAVALAFPEPILSAFTGSGATAAGAAPALRVVALGMLLVVPAELWLAAVFGTGDTDAGFAIELVMSVALVAACALAVLVLHLGLPVVWALLPAASALGLVGSFLWVRSGLWRAVAV
jgi:Na+-driven multidrug efflux pump